MTNPFYEQDMDIKEYIHNILSDNGYGYKEGLNASFEFFGLK